MAVVMGRQLCEKIVTELSRGAGDRNTHHITGSSAVPWAALEIVAQATRHLGAPEGELDVRLEPFQLVAAVVILAVAVLAGEHRLLLRQLVDGVHQPDLPTLR